MWPLLTVKCARCILRTNVALRGMIVRHVLDVLEDMLDVREVVLDKLDGSWLALGHGCAICADTERLFNTTTNVCR